MGFWLRVYQIAIFIAVTGWLLGNATENGYAASIVGVMAAWCATAIPLLAWDGLRRLTETLVYGVAGQQPHGDRLRPAAGRRDAGELAKLRH